MKKLAVIALATWGLWWYFVGGRTITTEHVEDYYRKYEHALLSRNPDGLCQLLDDKFQGSDTTTVLGQEMTTNTDRAKACASFHETFETIKDVGNKLGGIAQLDSDYDIESISISPDRKSAKVVISYSLDVAGRFMQIRSQSTETLVRRNGKVLGTQAESKTVTRLSGM